MIPLSLSTPAPLSSLTGTSGSDWISWNLKTRLQRKQTVNFLKTLTNHFNVIVSATNMTAHEAELKFAKTAIKALCQVSLKNRATIKLNKSKYTCVLPCKTERMKSESWTSTLELLRRGRGDLRLSTLLSALRSRHLQQQHGLTRVTTTFLNDIACLTRVGFYNVFKVRVCGWRKD